jgi:hypothetical protein
MVAVGFETITVANTAIGGTLATFTPTSGALAGEANLALFGPLETAQVRWRDDGTAPTSTVGHLLEVGQVLEYDGDVGSISFIRTGGTSGALPVTYYRSG